MEFRVHGETFRVNVPTWAALEARVAERFAQRKGFSLATINLDHLVKLAQSQDFRRAYAAHDMVVADGYPIVWLSRLAGRGVGRIAGSEAILPIARIAARQGVGVALVGSTDPVLAASKSYLEREVPGLTVVCCISPPMGFDPKGEAAAEIAERVAASGARMCFLALGAPRQEVFAAFAQGVAPEVGFASIGAGLDFFAGAQKRAPKWMRDVAMEWLWRLLENPRRLGPRYLKCLAILPAHAVKALVLRMRGTA